MAFGSQVSGTLSKGGGEGVTDLIRSRHTSAETAGKHSGLSHGL